MALRFGEVVELRRRDVTISTDQDGAEWATFTIERNATTVNGRLVVGTPKTQAGRRTVTLPPHLVPALRAHLDAYTLDEPDALVFPTVRGVRLSSSSLAGLMKSARLAAGLAPMHFHDLRHTGGTLAAQVPGTTLKDVMTRLGHSTPGAAMIYQHAVAAKDRQVACGMSALVELPANVVATRPAA
jgi:integrase